MNNKIYIVKRPSGSYEDYQEPIEKCFFDKDNANKYIESENKKLPLEQAEKCKFCRFWANNPTIKGKEKPECCDWDKYNTCQNYFKYHDIYPLEIEEHNIEDLHDHDKELVAKISEFINELAWKDIQYDAVQSTIGEFNGSRSAIPIYAKRYLNLWKQMFGEDLENKG